MLFHKKLQIVQRKSLLLKIIYFTFPTPNLSIMRKTKFTLLIPAFLLCFLSCQKTPVDKASPAAGKTRSAVNLAARGSLASTTATGENFETGTKTSYAAADVTLVSGVWNLNDALLGTSTSDIKNGVQSARVRNSGKLTMKFDVPAGASTVTILHAKYGTDANGTWQLWYSIDGGTNYTQTGSTITTSTTTLQTATFTVNVSGAVRFEIRKTDAGTNRICFDDITINDYTADNPAPTLSSISPSSASAGGTTFTLTATGTSFINGSVINWNGAALTTTFVSATQLTASLPAANIAAAGTADVTVVTATPGGGTSTAATFTITFASNPAPVLSSISPSSATAGGTAFTLTATGTSFINGSVINWNGTALTTTYVSATQLTTSVPATNIATAGTANVTVVTPSPGGGTSTAATFTINAVSTVKKYLFDASQGETAGNADWVIDEDNSTPQRIPTPLQSTITSSTSETYWTGAISSWGIALAKLGHTVETLPSTGSITYGSTTNTQDLSRYDVFVVDEPNIRFTAAEKVAILNFVNNGGGLLMISSHTVSDRNNDGWDSPAIWNDLMNNNTVQNNPFGFAVDLANFSQVTSNVLTSSSTNPVLNGSQGTVTQMEFNNGTTATLNTTANPNVKGLIWKSSTTQNSSNVMAASSAYGNGRIFFVGDSSPMDDGTGAPNNNLFNGWGVYSHKKLFMNASLWLAKLQ
jgi:hypothetical protein